MGPPGAAESTAIAVVLQLSTQIAQHIISSSGATKDRRRLREEVVACESVLLQIQESIEEEDDEDDWGEKVRVLQGPDTPLHRLELVLGAIKTKLEPKLGLGKVWSVPKWPFHEKAVEGILASIQREISLLQLALTCDEPEIVRQVTQKAGKNQELLQEALRLTEDKLARDDSRHDEVASSLASSEMSQTRLKDEFAGLRQRHMETDRNQILDWLTPVDYSPQQNDFFKRRQAGTGQWLLDSAEFQDWLQNEKQTLFCHGNPGAGKTILTSLVVDNVTSRFSKDENVAVAYVFCDFRRQDRQRAEDLIASLLKQLCQSQHPIPDAVRMLYNPKEPKKTPPYNDLCEALQKAVALYSRVYVVIDALDECQEAPSHRSRFLEVVFDLQKEAGINIFATSRNDADLTERFGSAKSLEIRASEADVRSYVEARMSELPKFVRERSDLQEEVMETIIPAVDGMFLLVKLHLDSLVGTTTAKGLRRALTALSDMPVGAKAYDEAYAEAMDRIEGQGADYEELAKQVLAWVTCARRPLSKLELQHALSIEVDESSLDEDNIPHIDLILSVCAGLVTIDEESDVVRLVHYTTQEFFERTQSSWFPDAEEDITHACLTYLLYDIFENGPCMTCEMLLRVLETFPFYEYAACYWGYHARELSTVPQLALDFLLDRNKLDLAVQTTLGEARSRKLDDFPNFPLDWTPLHVAAYFGMERLAESHDVEDLDAHDGFRATPLCMAAKYGYEAIVKHLLGQGAETDPVDKHGKTPLILAAANGHEAIVKLLLAHGANLEAQDSALGQTPMLWAALNGQTRVVELLLAKGANADPVDGNGRTPLFLAVQNGHMDILELLLATDAVNTNPIDKEGANLLHVAANGGHRDVVELLLGMAEIKVALKDKLGRTPLFAAARHGRTDSVQLLLANGGANVNFGDNSGRTPLSGASTAGHMDIVQLLLASEGVDAGIKDKLGHTPLSKAVKSGEEGVVRLLLSIDGVEPNTRDVFGRTPLSNAVQDGCEGMVELLMSDPRVEVDATDIWWSTPLSMAARKGHVDIANLLLSSESVDIDSRDIGGRTPLWWATKAEKPDVVKLLREIAAERGMELSHENLPVRDGADELPPSGWSCDACTLQITSENIFYHCERCGGGDFDICGDCFEAGARCLDDSHNMSKQYSGPNGSKPRKITDFYITPTDTDPTKSAKGI